MKQYIFTRKVRYQLLETHPVTLHEYMILDDASAKKRFALLKILNKFTETLGSIKEGRI